MSRPTAGDLIAETLAALGIARVFGRPFPAPGSALAPVPVADADLALLLAEADGRLSGGWGAAYIDGQILHVSSQPGGPASARSVATPEGACAALAMLERDDRPQTLALHLDLDLDAPAGDDSLDAVAEPNDEVVVTLSPSLADLSMLLLVGPGVLRGGHVEGLVEVATRGGIGVLNTFGAKGVLRWDSPFHFGTVGLQERDLELAGVGDHDIVLTSGLDLAELPAGALDPFVVQDVAPWQLPALLADWPRAQREVGERPALYGRIADIVTPLYERGEPPLSPPRAALHLSGAAPDGAVVVADAGVAGFWIARTFPTGTPGSVVVPAYPQEGFAAAAALVAGLGNRPCVAVTDGPVDDATRTVLDLAGSMGVAVALQVWGDGASDPDTHVELTRSGFEGMGRPGAVVVDDVGLDLNAIEPLLGALGPVSAWSA